ncbi:helix-turn-helix domain-containing protein [Stratiformator vulcanicus]|uniref:helix-turn-helix domain-containing protein n=1 Tax=Stratiformator vulcanicus TaxID=2527980 RepID=UPI0028774B31|nr:helix-turn-helix domain-containing protein [Stratiformator vulcanicus]
MAIPEKKSQHFSPKELAKAISASESSVKRWIDDGKLKAVKTAGGHRRIAMGDAFRFIRENDQKLIDPASLGLGAIATVDFSDPAEIRTQYLEALESGDEPTTTGIVCHLHLLDRSIAAICDEPVHWAFRDLRSRCTHPSEECVVLHRGQSNSIHALQRLRELVVQPKTDAPSALLADIGYEIDGLSTYLAETVFADAGITCTQLGLSVPEAVLNGAISRVKPDVVWVSAMGGKQAQPEVVKKRLLEVGRLTAEQGSRLVLMGDAICSAREFGETPPTIINDMGELAAFADGMFIKAS